MGKANLVIDTSAFMGELLEIDKLSEIYNIIIPMVVLEELDNHKDNYKDSKRAFLGRTAVKYINKNLKEFECIDIKIDDKPDNVILQTAKQYNAKVVSLDLNMKVKAKYMGLDIVEIGDRQDDFKGFIEVFVDSNNEDTKVNQMVADIYSDMTCNPFNLYPNEYLIIKQKVGKRMEVKDVLCWDGSSFRKLNLPPDDVIKPYNIQQKCALDLLYNKDIPIKIIGGSFGSGKTKLATAVSYHTTVEKGEYSKMVLVRNSNSDESGDIGYLPGSFEDKTDILFQTITQHLPQGTIQANDLKLRGLLETHIPFFMKGLSISGFMIFDEAEDATLADIRKIGSRIEEDSCVAFVGDWEQSSGRYVTNNGMRQLVYKTKDNPLVGFVALDEVVRSDVSAVFADLK